MMVYSIADIAEIIELFLNNECGNRVADLFNQRHPEKHLSGKVVWELFRETGSVHNKKRNIDNAGFHEAMEIAVLGEVAISFHV